MNLFETKKLFAVAGIFFLCAGCSVKPSSLPATQNEPLNYSKKLLVKNVVLDVEVVGEISKMQTGLAGRSSMKDNQGMLFDFSAQQAVMPGFWMKGMEFNLDIIWIYKNKIIGISANAQAPAKNLNTKNENLPTYSPPAVITRVLEVNSGWAKKNNILVGDVVEILD